MFVLKEVQRWQPTPGYAGGDVLTKIRSAQAQSVCGTQGDSGAGVWCLNVYRSGNVGAFVSCFLCWRLFFETKPAFADAPGNVDAQMKVQLKGVCGFFFFLPVSSDIA